jgi:parallel beta helix pectate lyase-like protein
MHLSSGLMKPSLGNNGKTRRNSGRNDPCSTGGHPKLSTEKRRLQMNKFRFTLNILAIAIFMFAFASFAQGQATRTWVSGVGDDANPCSRTAPCKTFAGAISKTATGGIIDALDPAGFGGVTITKSIMIDGGPFQAGVLVSGTNAIVINATSTSVVHLRNLNVEGLGTGLDGIRILSAGRVYVQNVQVHGFRGAGGRGLIDARSTGGAVLVENSTFKDNTIGALINPTLVATVGTFKGCSFISNNQHGLQVNNFSFVTVEQCIADVNGQAGFRAEGVTTTATLTILRSRSNGNVSGIQALTGGTVRVGDTQITDNGNQLNTSGGVISSWGNNYVVPAATFNGTPLSFS